MQGFMAIEGEKQAHEQTFAGFMTLVKWGTIVCFVIAAIVVLIIAR